MFDQRLVDEIILFRRFARLWIKDLFFNLRMNRTAPMSERNFLTGQAGYPD